ncbi:MAG: hypothetical protein JOY82_11255 [Streptosporangiaceae bacterium]|nr:hypothetical protein [Streptosporangiaceae bacterium]MBV9855075.1 hypothetical protein [Streptosporangiaceae bacterium]
MWHGGPHRQPVPFRAGRYGCEKAIAWLLRANRVYGHDQRWATLTTFAAAFRGGCWPRPVSPSQISRWETAAAPAGFGVLRRYEELLGLPPGQLVAIADWAYRKASGRPGRPVLDRGLNPEDPRVQDRAGQLFERALSADLMTGTDWDELTSHLAVFPVAFVYPRTAWGDLSERLLAELLVTDGRAWLSRIEAVDRLLAHPHARPPLIAACAALAADPACQVVVEPLAILEQTADADAGSHVLAQLTHPSSDRALRGAMLAAVGKTRLGHFRPVQLRTVAAVAAGLLPGADPPSEAGALAAELLRLVSAIPGSAAEDRLRGVTDATIRAILAHGLTAVPDAAQRVTARILTAATARMRRPLDVAGTDPDPMLSCLVGDLLFSPNQNQRLLAGQLIAATPYRDRVGAALAAELAMAPANRAVSLTSAMLAAMPSVGRPADRHLVERFALATGLPAPITDAAAWGIGHTPGVSGADFWPAALATHTRAWQRTRSQASISALRGLIYGLGIGRHHDLLRSIRADTAAPAPARMAAGWWLNIPVRILASAAR